MEIALKQPVSCLVVIHTKDRVLLLERADAAGFWQSVTGSWELSDASLYATACRELFEETGFSTANGVMRDLYWANQYEIYPRWRHRYPPNTTVNTEHIFSFLLAEPLSPRLAVDEHVGYAWLTPEEAIARVFSPTNALAIRCIFKLEQKRCTT